MEERNRGNHDGDRRDERDDGKHEGGNGKIKGTDDGRKERKRERKKKREGGVAERERSTGGEDKEAGIGQRKEKREEEKNKIVIKGARWRKENLKQEVGEFLKNNFKVKTKIKNAKIITQRGEKDIVIAEVNT